MKNLFDNASMIEIRDRIKTLNSSSERQWGVMNVAQMLAHCTAWMEMASGQRSSPRSFAGRIFGKLAKKIVLGQSPIRRNMPTDTSLAVEDERDFFAEQRRLLDSLDRFSTGGTELCTKHPHSFFGLMTPLEWGIMGYKHLDHHLKQFGA